MKSISKLLVALLVLSQTFLDISFAKDAHEASNHGAKTSVSAETSLGWLKNGNTRFKKGFLRKDGQSQADIKRLSTGQAPHAIVLSCSDSRVPPEVLFDQKLGEIFTVRTAGQTLDNNAIGSIEYAVEHLGAKLIVVMGHTACGAVKAALGTMNGGDAGSPALNALVKDIHPRIKGFKEKNHSENYVAEGWANTEGVAKDLLVRSEILRKKYRSGEIQIETGLYHLDSGDVEFQKNKK